MRWLYNFVRIMDSVVISNFFNQVISLMIRISLYTCHTMHYTQLPFVRWSVRIQTACLRKYAEILDSLIFGKLYIQSNECMVKKSTHLCQILTLLETSCKKYLFKSKQSAKKPTNPTEICTQFSRCANVTYFKILVPNKLRKNL